jgi:hypothetical protein
VLYQRQWLLDQPCARTLPLWDWPDTLGWLGAHERVRTIKVSRVNNGRLTVIIGGREALPLRAIPYVTSWSESPDSIVQALVEPPIIKVGLDYRIPNKRSLVAYLTLDSERYVALPPRQLKDILVSLNSLTKKLKADERLGAVDENHAIWRIVGTLKLPDNVFVWLDEFQAWYSATRSLTHGDGDATLIGAVIVEREKADSNVQRLEALEADLLQSSNDSLWLTPVLPPEIEGRVWRYVEASLPKAVTAIPNNALYSNTESTNEHVSKQAVITVHRLANRSNTLRSVILKATENAAPPKDTQCVWAELVRLAESKDRPAPLLGFSDGEGVKYQDIAGVKFFTRKNLGDRMRRAKTR